jgi:hypothetical protein
MNNKLDSFNKDKRKCKKCKKYYDKISMESKVFIYNGIKTLRNEDLCEDCNVIWAEIYWNIMMNWKNEKSNFEDWCNK